MAADPAPETFVVHSETEVVYADELFCTLVGADSRDQVIGETLTDLIAPEYHAPFLEQVSRVGSGQASALGLALDLRTFAGERREVIAVSSPIEWEEADRVRTSFLTVAGDAPAVGGTVRDWAIDEAPIGITISDPSQPDNPIVYLNDGFLELTGYSREEVLGRNCRFLQGEHTREEPVAAMREAIEVEEPVTVELRNYREDGSMFWNRVTITPISTPSGTVSHYLGYQQDVTSRKVLAREKTLFEEQADVADQAVFITDRDGTIEYVNPAFERITGYSAEEALGATPRILKSGQQDGDFYEDLWETITLGDVWEAELTNETKDGQLYQVEQKIVPVTDDRGEITHFAAIEKDVTDRVLKDQTLEMLNRVLRHNLRTSVNIIDGYADILETNPAESDHQAAVRAIQDQTAAMEKIADRTARLRELSEQADTTVTWDSTDVAALVETYREQYPDAEIDLTTESDGGVRLPNAELLKLALDEAIENAVIHAEETPRVTVTIARNEDDDRVDITVADTGPGVPETELTAINEGVETALIHGTGIGLWLMKWVTTALGGELELAENDPRGTVVTFRLPGGRSPGATGDDTG